MEPELSADRKARPNNLASASAVAAIVALLVSGGTYLHEHNRSEMAQNKLQDQLNTLKAQIATASPTAAPLPTATPSASPVAATPAPTASAAYTPLTTDAVFQACASDPLAAAKGSDGYDFICAQKEVFFGDFEGTGHEAAVIIQNTNAPKALGIQRFVLYENKNGVATYAGLSNSLAAYQHYVLPIAITKGEIDATVDQYAGSAQHSTVVQKYTTTSRGLDFTETAPQKP